MIAGSGAGRDDDDDDDGNEDAGSGDVIHKSLDSGEAKTTGAPTPRTADDDDDHDGADEDNDAVASVAPIAAASTDGRGVRNDGK